MITRAQSKEIGASVRCIHDAQTIFSVAYLEKWLVNAVDKDLVTSYTIRVKHIGSLVVRVELPVGDCQRQVERAGGKRRRVGGVIHDVHSR